MRKSPFSFFGPWQLMQWSLRKPSNDLLADSKVIGSEIIKITALSILKFIFSKGS
jgi:hypothetical protein